MAAHGPMWRRNSFQETLLGLEYAEPADQPADLFSQACVEQYRDVEAERFGYLFAQVFEPGVLQEVCLLEGVSYSDVENLEVLPTASLQRLAEAARAADQLSLPGQVNVAAALISISRFGPAHRVLMGARRRASSARDVFEVAMLEFVIANRQDDVAVSQSAFVRMRAAIETKKLPPDRVLDACAQAVVWHLKRQEISVEDYAWFTDTGRAVADRSNTVDPGALSSWYRAIAMVPAAKGEADLTRQYMDHARTTAEQTFALRPRAYELHFLKTYHESSMKEHMFLTRDLSKAEESGRALIALDPAWAPSYGELGDAFYKFGEPTKAAELYEEAVRAGPPYVGHHLLSAANARRKAGHGETAVAHYLAIARLATVREQVLSEGLALAEELGEPSAAFLADALTARRRTADGEC